MGVGLSVNRGGKRDVLTIEKYNLGFEMIITERLSFVFSSSNNTPRNKGRWT